LSLFLTIDTSTETASACVAEAGKILSIAVNGDQKDHASWLHIAIGKLMKDCGKDLSELNALAVSAGPGSYTGLRVGMATAKGLCYALGIPLIVESSLKMMSYAALRSINSMQQQKPVLLCPMIDARRMEVFTAVYRDDLSELHEPTALIIDEHSYSRTLEMGKTVFFGNGAAKWKQLCRHPNAHFMDINFNAGDLIFFAEEKFKISAFADLAYVEPLYVKEFHTLSKNSSASSFNEL
jgi:tRNA threonylcarbamoyladenosine biosynthesis protein TsaB